MGFSTFGLNNAKLPLLDLTRASHSAISTTNSTLDLNTPSPNVPVNRILSSRAILVFISLSACLNGSADVQTGKLLRKLLAMCLVTGQLDE